MLRAPSLRDEAPCTHELIDSLFQDWKVVCKFPDTSFYREYRVHLLVKQYGQNVRIPGKRSYEVLYWVTDWTNTARPTGHSATFWVHLDEVSNWLGFDITQGVDNDTAGLYLKMKALNAADPT